MNATTYIQSRLASSPATRDELDTLARNLGIAAQEWNGAFHGLILRGQVVEVEGAPLTTYALRFIS